MLIGLFFWVLIMALHDKIAFIFAAVDELSVLLVFTILLNSIQHVLSGLAVGSGWQSTVPFACYYVIGIPWACSSTLACWSALDRSHCYLDHGPSCSFWAT
jgi:hypothetical protein